jgi:DNA-binding SARP family transcriptional activator
VTSDVGWFDEAVRCGDLRNAVALWTGPFLDGFCPGCGAPFEEWKSDRQEHYAQALAEVLNRLASEAEAREDLVEAADWWDRLLAHQPLSGHALETAMRALHRTGDPAAALARFEQYRLRLERDYDVTPHSRLVALAEAIRSAVSRDRT